MPLLTEAIALPPLPEVVKSPGSRPTPPEIVKMSTFGTTQCQCRSNPDQDTLVVYQKGSGPNTSNIIMAKVHNNRSNCDDHYYRRIAKIAKPRPKETRFEMTLITLIWYEKVRAVPIKRPTPKHYLHMGFTLSITLLRVYHHHHINWFIKTRFKERDLSFWHKYKTNKIILLISQLVKVTFFDIYSIPSWYKQYSTNYHQ